MKHLKLKTMSVWELRDHGYSDEMRNGYRTNMREYEDVHEAYECGYEDGYEEAMEYCINKLSVLNKEMEINADDN